MVEKFIIAKALVKYIYIYTYIYETIKCGTNIRGMRCTVYNAKDHWIEKMYIISCKIQYNFII